MLKIVIFCLSYVFAGVWANQYGCKRFQEKERDGKVFRTGEEGATLNRFVFLLIIVASALALMLLLGIFHLMGIQLPFDGWAAAFLGLGVGGLLPIVAWHYLEIKHRF